MTCTDSNPSSPESAPGSSGEERTENSNNEDDHEGNGISNGSNDGDHAGEQHAVDNDNDISRGPGVSGTQDIPPPSGTSVGRALFLDTLLISL